MGGIAIVLAYVATFAIALALPFSYTHILHRALPQILELTAVGFIVFLTGVLDDLVGLTPQQKLIGIGAAASFAYASGIRVDVHLLPGAVSRATFQLAYLLTVDDDVRATAVTVHGCVDADGKARRLPAWVGEAF